MQQRRVSFAEEVDTRLYEVPSGRVLGRSKSPKSVIRCLDMPKNVPSPLTAAENNTENNSPVIVFFFFHYDNENLILFA